MAKLWYEIDDKFKKDNLLHGFKNHLCRVSTPLLQSYEISNLGKFSEEFTEFY